MLHAVLAVTVLAQGPGPGAEPPARAGIELSKKEAYLAAKRDAPTSARPVRPEAVAPVWAHNLRTHEIMPLGDVPGLDERAYDRFLRCWFTNEHADLPTSLVQSVVDTARHFDKREVRVISGFRHPKYNLSLRKKGREVAENSEHTQGHAIDFFLPGVDTRVLYDYLLAHHGGGVGYYPVSEFVHVDLGRKRTWRGT